MHSGIAPSTWDDAVRPQDDLFGHVNGRWIAETEIPEDRAAHGAFYILRDNAEEALRELIEEAAASGPAPGTPARKVGDLYASFMDEERVEAAGLTPIAADLAAIEAVTSQAGFLELLGSLQRQGVGGAIAPFVDTDARNSERYLVHFEQAGLGLPDESYYRDDDFAEVRAAYQAHVAALLRLAEVVADEAAAADAAARVLALETRLAAGHWDVVASRDAVKTYNLVERDALDAAAPGLEWSAWFSGFRPPAGAFDEVVVRQPGYLTTLAEVLHDVPLDDWKLWLELRVVSSAAPFLTAALVEQNFDFYGRTLSGTPQQRERWKRGVSLVESSLGEAAGQLYVERHFPPEAKERMLELVGNLIEAYRRSISDLPWMGEDTRRRALEKLERFVPKVGYPDQWRDYSSLDIDRHDLLGNVRASADFETRRELDKLGRPVDRGEWFMTPQTVNAYYNPGMNEIVFPAAILQPPFFDLEADDAVNYGAIGAVIGHEIGHGFDDQGSRYDGTGNLVDWWTDDDRARFDELTAALITQYAAFEPRDLPGHPVNGALTVGENIGDLGGLSIAHRAYRLSLEGKEAPVLDGLTGDQRFFAGWAYCWQTKTREAEALRRLATDPHSPPEFRANVVRNLVEFYDAFGVTEGDELWLAEQDRVRIF